MRDEPVTVAPRGGGVPDDLGAPELPASKSHAQRALLLAAGAAAPVRIHGGEPAADTLVLVRALRGLGAAVEDFAGGWLVNGGLRPGISCEATLDLEENGTAARSLPLVVALLQGRARFDGAPGLRRRPLGPTLDLLRQGEVEVTTRGLPLAVDARDARWPPQLRVDASLSSQPASGAVLGLALRVAHGLARAGSVRVVRPAAGGYVALTLQLARMFGHQVAHELVDHGARITVTGPPGPAPATYTVPPDPSAAVFVAVLAALHHRTWRSPWDRGDAHPDSAVARDLAALAAVAPSAPVSLDLGGHPDAFPALCVAAAARPGPTTLTGGAALRAKESDRIAAMARGLAAVGVSCRERPDGLSLRGGLATDTATSGPRVLPATADHRVVMALALLGTVLPRGVTVPHRAAVTKSWPGFFAWLARVAAVR